jgi:hypothetical protein
VNEPETTTTIVTPYIEIERLPDKTEYELNEWYNLSGGEVRVGEIIDDGTNITDTGRTVSMTDSQLAVDSSAYRSWEEGTYIIKIGYRPNYDDKYHETVYTELKVTVGISEEEEYSLGDVDNNGIVNSADASMILAEYSRIATSKPMTFTEAQKKAADINNDGITDSTDASTILKYYAYISTHPKIPFEEFLQK